MANPLEQGIAAFASLITVLILYTIFGPIVTNNLNSLVMDSLASPTGFLVENAGALGSTATYVILAIEIMPWFVCAVVLFRIFVYVSFKTEEVTY